MPSQIIAEDEHEQVLMTDTFCLTHQIITSSKNQCLQAHN